MKISDISFTFHTSKLAECVDFYVKHFSAGVTFDWPWYKTIRFDSESERSLYMSFIHPSHSDKPMPEGGATLNFLVKDVDGAYRGVKESGLPLLEEISDKEWGDRSFSFADPMGNILYVYSERPMDEKYLKAIKDG